MANMFAESVVRLTIAAALVTYVYAAGQKIIAAPPNKDARCHAPNLHMCNVGISEMSKNHTVIAWFYYAPFKSCHPLWGKHGKNECIENQDLPKSKVECENLCSEPCTVQRSNFTEPGICMLEKYCKIPTPSSANPRPCRSYNVKCCPKDHQVVPRNN